MSKTEDGSHPRLDAPTIVWRAGVVPPVRLVPEKWAPVAHPIVSDDCAATHGECIFPCQKAAASAAPVLPAEQLCVPAASSGVADEIQVAVFACVPICRFSSTAARSMIPVAATRGARTGMVRWEHPIF